MLVATANEFRQNPTPLLFCTGQNGLRNAYAVHGGGHNAARIACALAAGVDPAQIGLQILAPDDPDRGGRTCFHAGHHGVRKGKATQLCVKERDGFPHGVCCKARQNGRKIAETDAERIRGTDAPSG